MRIFDTIRKMFFSSLSTASTYNDDLLPEEKALLSNISKINAKGGNLPPDLYQKFREFEMNWLERHYDFNTIDGINSIAVSPNLPGAPSPTGSMKGHTGEVYYYLRHKAYAHEDAGNIDLALDCMKKSVALVKCRSFFSSEDMLPLVKMLARAGRVEEAYAELRAIEKCFSTSLDCNREIEAEIRRGHEQRDYLWIQANIPDKCPKSISSYRRMKTQNTKNFQTLKALAAELGRQI